MAIIRGPRPTTFWYPLDKRIAEDNRLTWEARGVLIYLLCKPDDWNVSVQALANLTEHHDNLKSGRDRIQRILNELRDAGYVTRKKYASGAICYIVSELTAMETSQGIGATPAKPKPAEPKPAKPKPAEPTLQNTHSLKNTQSLTENTDLFAGEAEEPKPKKGRLHPIPPDFTLSAGVRRWAAEKGYTHMLEERFERFKSYAERSGKMYVNWDAALKGAIREDWADLGPADQKGDEVLEKLQAKYGAGVHRLPRGGFADEFGRKWDDQGNEKVNY